MGFTKLGNDELAKRAAWPRRVLYILGGLNALFAIPGVCTVLASPPARWFWSVLLFLICVAIAAMAGGYFLLALAARKGNATAFLVGQFAFVLQVLSLLLCGWLRPFEPSVFGPRTDTEGGDAILIVPAALICAIVVIVLDLGRRALKELQRRGAWERRFGLASPHRKLWLPGTLIVAGLLCLVGSVATLADQTRRFNENCAFSSLLGVQEREFLDAAVAVRKENSPANRELATRRIDALGDKAAQLKRTIARGSRLLAILEKYEEAVAQWKLATAMIAVAEPDLEKAWQLFLAGDDLRQKALREFNRCYHKVLPERRLK